MKIYTLRGRWQWYLAEAATEAHYTMKTNWYQQHRTCSVRFRFKINAVNTRNRVCSERSRGARAVTWLALARWQFSAPSIRFRSLMNELGSKCACNNNGTAAHRKFQCKFNGVEKSQNSRGNGARGGMGYWWALNREKLTERKEKILVELLPPLESFDKGSEFSEFMSVC